MKKRFRPWTVAAFLIIALSLGLAVGPSAMAADEDVRMALVKQSTLEEILQRGELRVGFEAGYVPFEMTDKKGNFVGFDIDMAKEMAKAMGVKFVPVNTAWDGIIPALLTKKFDIIMSGMTITQERNLKINFCDPYIVVGQTCRGSRARPRMHSRQAGESGPIIEGGRRGCQDDLTAA